MDISHPYLFLINKTPKNLEQAMKTLQQTGEQTIHHNGHFYNVSQLLEMLESARASNPVFYKCCDSTFIKYGYK